VGEKTARPSILPKADRRTPDPQEARVPKNGVVKNLNIRSRVGDPNAAKSRNISGESLHEVIKEKRGVEAAWSSYRSIITFFLENTPRILGKPYAMVRRGNGLQREKVKGGIKNDGRNSFSLKCLLVRKALVRKKKTKTTGEALCPSKGSASSSRNIGSEKKRIQDKCAEKGGEESQRERGNSLFTLLTCAVKKDLGGKN